MLTRPPTPAAGSPSRKTREPQAASAAVRLWLGDLRLPGGAYRCGAAARRRGAHGMDLRSDPHPDPKSTRLNSRHSQNSYAVFCLKKKNKASTQLTALY